MTDDYCMRMGEKSQAACGVQLCPCAALLIDPGARDVRRLSLLRTYVRVRRLRFSVGRRDFALRRTCVAF